GPGTNLVDGQCVPIPEPPACDASNCSGCCSGDVCVVGTTTAAWGTGGMTCSTCGAGNVCNAGVCKPSGTCHADAECAVSQYCNDITSSCLPDLPNSSACSKNSMCMSNL